MNEAELVRAPELLTFVDPIFPQGTNRFYTGFRMQLGGVYRGRGFVVSDVYLLMN